MHPTCPRRRKRAHRPRSSRGTRRRQREGRLHSQRIPKARAGQRKHSGLGLAAPRALPGRLAAKRPGVRVPLPDTLPHLHATAGKVVRRCDGRRVLVYFMLQPSASRTQKKKRKSEKEKNKKNKTLTNATLPRTNAALPRRIRTRPAREAVTGVRVGARAAAQARREAGVGAAAAHADLGIRVARHVRRVDGARGEVAFFVVG